MISLVPAQRLSVVIEEAIERLELVTSLSPGAAAAATSSSHIGKNRREALTTVSMSNTSHESTQHMQKLLSEQKRLQKVYAELIERRNTVLRQEGNVHSWEGSHVGAALDQEIVAATRGLRQCTNFINQAMSKDDPSNVRKLIEVHKQRVALTDVLRQTVFELRELSFGSLHDKVHYHLEQEELLNETQKRQELISETRMQLEYNISSEQEAYEQDLLKKDQQIEEYMNKLKMCNAVLQIDLKYLKATSKAEIHTLNRERQNMLSSLDKGAIQCHK